ncbi:MAG: LPS export ABC transporter permease LptF [Gammaproteobacteria bacterium]|nr:LPS export ABC transporter permease LptF [Gammaproteobacteria bacterium]
MIIRDYIIKEVLRTFAGVFIVIFLIILSTQFLRALSLVVDGKIALDFLFSLIFFKNLESLTLIIPLTLFVSIILALSRLYKDSEMVALSACGIDPMALLKSILIVIFMFVFLEAGLSMIVAPWANYKVQYAEEAFKSQADLELITPGQFNIADQGKRVLFTQEMPEATTLKNVFLHLDNEDSESVLVSEYATIAMNSKQNARYIVFQEGSRYDGIPGSLDYRVVHFKDYGVLMEGKMPNKIRLDRESLRLPLLLNSTKASYKAELQWRISQVLMMILLAMLAVPLSKTKPRQGRYGKMALAILIYIAYSNLLVVAMNWVRKEVVPSSFGMWWVHSLFLLLFLILFSYQMGWFNRFKHKA